MAHSLWWNAARSAVTAALAGAAACVVAAVLCWLPDAGVSGRPSSAIRAGLLSFLAAQHGGFTLDRVSGSFLPLGMLVGVAIFAWRAGRAVVDSADGDDAGDPDQLTVGRLAGALVLGATCYAGCVVALVHISRLGTSHAPAIGAPLAAFLMYAVVAGVSMARAADAVRPLAAQLPPLLVGALRGAAMATAVYLGAGALLAASSIAMHAHRVMQLSREVGGGLSGLPVLFINLLCAPNAAIAGSAYLAGPGFAVGRGTTVNAFATSHGVLPALPILGAIPDGHGANPAVLGAMCLVALLASVCVARAVRRSGSPGFARALGGAAASGAMTGIAMATLAWLGGGSAGSGRLRVVGASPWRVGLAITAAVSTLSVLAVIVLAVWDRIAPAAPVPASVADRGSPVGDSRLGQRDHLAGAARR